VVLPHFRKWNNSPPVTRKQSLNNRQRKILVVRPDRIGDVVLSTPVYHTLKDSFPGSFIGALVSPGTRPLLEMNPHVDLILTDSSTQHDFWEKVREIRSHKFDTALLLMPTQRHAYMMFLAGIPQRVGVGHILYEILTMMKGVSRRNYIPLRHESDYMLDLARKIGATAVWTRPEVFLSPDEKETAREYLRSKGITSDGKIVGIHPGSGHSAPNWTIDRYVELANRLVDSGMQVVITGDRMEYDLAAAFGRNGNPDLKNTIGELSLRQLAAVISRLDLFISGSTGPMHIAAALGIKTVSMFCPLTACSPKLWGPLGNSATVISPDELFCKTKCPGDPHICTFGTCDEGITVESILASQREVIVS